jgi:hypothetical protein
MKNKWLKPIFIFESILFILVLLFLFTELNELLPIAPVFAFIIFSPLGLVQFFLVKKNIEDKKLKISLMINGLSSFGVAFFAVLHNLFYALAQLIGEGIFVKILGFLEGTFFVVAIVACPIVFLITSILSVIFYYKSRGVEQKK